MVLMVAFVIKVQLALHFFVTKKIGCLIHTKVTLSLALLKWNYATTII